MNGTNPLNYFYQLISQPLKDCVPIGIAIRGDFARYGETILNLYNNVTWHRDYDTVEQDGKEIHVRFHNKCDVDVYVIDKSQYYNHLQIFITDNRNHVEFIASNVNHVNNTIIAKEESEYIYEPDTKRSYVYYSKTSYSENDEVYMTHTYDEKGNEVARSMHGGTIKQVKVKTK